MGKVFFVINNPEKCGKCPIVQGEEETVMFCSLVTEPNECVKGGEMWKQCPQEGKPDWCPLKPMIEKDENKNDWEFQKGE